MKFSDYLLFLIVWSLCVYAPLAHWVWGGGFIGARGMLDFAGGTVVHISAGMAALASVFVLGPRKNEQNQTHSIPFVLLGTGLLWFGWYGFNAGSALAANGQAAFAFVNTQVAAAMAMVTWLFLSWIIDGRPSVLGACSGVLAGLVAITPAAGFVTPLAALVIGFFASCVCVSAVKFRQLKKWDDALDVWAVHGIGGVTGSLLTGVFAAKTVGGFSGLLEGSNTQFMANVYGTVVAAVFAFTATFVILKVLTTLSPKKTSDQKRLIDETEFGERAYE